MSGQCRSSAGGLGLFQTTITLLRWGRFLRRASAFTKTASRSYVSITTRGKQIKVHDHQLYFRIFKQDTTVLFMREIFFFKSHHSRFNLFNALLFKILTQWTHQRKLSKIIDFYCVNDNNFLDTHNQ